MSNFLTINYTLFFPPLKCYYYKSKIDFPDREVSYHMGDLPVVELYTDGACSGNPGPGGYGAILRYGSIEKELSGGEPETTKSTPTPSTSATASRRAGRKAGSRTAGARRTKNLP